VLFDRQRRLLALLRAVGGSIGGLDFQKLLFLYTREVEQVPSYEFVPYRFGGFSFTSYADKRRLIERHLLADDERVWSLTEAGLAATNDAPQLGVQVQRFAQRYLGLRGEALVADTYRRYPYFAIRSEIAARLLAEDDAALAAIDAARPATGAAGICTIGYEGRSLEGYLNELIHHGATLLCDVRRNPLSRKYGFSRKTLAKACEGVGITYTHLPELGIASEARRGLRTQADYDALFATYEQCSLPQQTIALNQISAWVDGGHKVALTCFEKVPEQCHRRCVAAALEQSFGSGFVATHL